mgnify:CR=1 FL=1|tara:strand:- start:28 stop:432 length:405 start_codon:yes stop_codon:yes gene_type:complete
MSINKDKSEIAESFRHLLQKADEMALNKKKDDLIEKLNLDENEKHSAEVNNDKSKVLSKDRLGISNIKRIPENPFILNNKVKSEEYLKNRKELIIKLSIILNKHIHYWLQKEMPQFSKLQLEKHIYSLLKDLKK